MNKKTLVLGASLKPNRYSHYAIQRLVAYGVEVVAIGLRKGKVSSVEIDTEPIGYKHVHTVTLYLNAKRQKAYYHYIISLAPERVVFNPGAENPEFFELLNEHKIPYEASCTLVLLSTNQY